MSYTDAVIIRCKDCGDKIVSSQSMMTIRTAVCVKCQQMAPDYVPQHQAEADRIAAAKALDSPIPYTPVTREQIEIPELNVVPRRESTGNPIIKRHSPRVATPDPVPEEKEGNAVQQQLKSAMGSLKKTWKTKSSMNKTKKK